MLDERRQAQILYGDFLHRMIDIELLPSGGDARQLLGQFAAVLAGFDFVFALFGMPRYVFSTLPANSLKRAAWGDQEFLISTTLCVAGVFAVLAWNAVLPDRRDSLVLGPLPLRMRTIFRAKLAAIGTALGLVIVALNIFTGLCLPFLINGSEDSILAMLRTFAAYWLTMAGAGLFACGAVLAVEGIALQLLRYSAFLRVSGVLQLAAFLTILAVYLLTPPLATVRGLTAPENQRLLHLLPSFWFLGLFQELNGPSHAAFGPLAGRAVYGLLAVLTACGVVYSLAYTRTVRRIVEQPDIAPSDRSRSQLLHAVATRLLSTQLERAVVLFTARTIARSRQHRLLLAAYAGVSLAIALAYAKSLFYGYGRTHEHWNQLNFPLLVASLVPLIFAVLGMRAVFALPIALPANWIFRLTTVHRPAEYFAATRKALFTLAALPIWIAAAALYLTIWPARPALAHLAVLAAGGSLLIYRALYRFRKVPFTCSYLPGKSQLNVKIGAYAILFVAAIDFGAQIEVSAIPHAPKFAVLLGLLIAAAVWSRSRTRRFAAAAGNRLQFEDVPTADIHALDLRQDGYSSSDEAYVAAIE